MRDSWQRGGVASRQGTDGYRLCASILKTYTQTKAGIKSPILLPL